MYKEFFLLDVMPFSIAPDPRFLYMSERHCEAMAHLLYGVQGEGGIVLLTGEVGTGKTTICRSLIDQLPENVDVAFILNPGMSVEELLQTICEELLIRIDSDKPGIKTFIDVLNFRLLSLHAQGRRVILIVDEAQNLDAKVLEQLRLLTNLETSTRKLLQIFLVGQPELLSMLSRPEMRQVNQRVVARYHLTHLSQNEVNSYVAHRLRVSGASSSIFPEKLIKQVYRASGGVPRLINLICDRALLGAYVQRCEQITKRILRKAAEEVLPSQSRRHRVKVVWAACVVLLVVSICVFATQLFDFRLGIKPAAFKYSLDNAKSSDQMLLNTSVAFVANGAVPSLNTLNNPAPRMPGGMAAVDSEAAAFESLFMLYGIHIDTQSEQSPCQQAETQGMRCYPGHGGLSALFQLDQPVLMRLTTADGKGYWVTLISIDHQTAILKVGGKEQRVPLSELASSWFGQYIAIWNSPPDYKGKIRLKYHGPSVTWLRHALESIDGIRDNGSDIFDEALAKRVRLFQLADGIQPDGLIGPLTLIRLGVRSGNVKPHLATEQRG